jgi:hypothetical protein
MTKVGWVNAYTPRNDDPRNNAATHALAMKVV